MKKSLFLFAACATSIVAFGQSSFVYDQQSNTNETPIPGGAVLQELMVPYGQSFTPKLARVDFIRLKLYDYKPGNTLGAVMAVNLRADNVGGPILAASLPVSLGDGFAGPVNFLFANPPDLIPNRTYYFQPVVQSGDSWLMDAYEYRYPGGSAWYNGLPIDGSDYWFREGIIVPEPGTGAVLGLGLAVMAWVRRPRSS